MITLMGSQYGAIRYLISYKMTNLFRRYYGSVGPNFGFFNVSIDGSTPQRLNATSNLSLDQRMLWSSTTLSPGRHNLTLTHDDARPNKTLCLDFLLSVISNVNR